MIKTVLEKHNCRVTHVTDGKLGLETAQNEKPDLILLDLLVPGVHGFELCKMLKNDEQTKNIPVIAMSAVYKPAFAGPELKDAGVDAFIEKPLHLPALRDKIERFFPLQDEPGEEDRSVKDQLQRLRSQYIEELPEKISELISAWRFLQQNFKDQTSLSRFRMLAHKLHGSGTTFGFKNVTDYAKKIEEILLKAMDIGEEVLVMEQDKIIELLKNLHSPAQQVGK
ncbi:MAG: response regulator [Candidatus Aminicenantes bacterium]|nr:response regulator [Candidatus Aminicenantes bacterium]